MNTEPPSITAFVSKLSGVGIGILVTMAVLIVTWVILRALVRRWQRRSRALDQTAAEKLQRFDHRMRDLEQEAGTYPPDIPDPYQQPAQALKTHLVDGRRAYREIAEARTQITAEMIEVPDRPAATVLFGFWSEPVFWFRRMTALKQLHDRIQAAVEATRPADALLRDLRAKPLHTAHRAQALQQTLREASATVDQLNQAGLQGETMEAQATLIDDALACLGTLPAYLITGTDSQVIRQAVDEEVADAWQAITRLEARTGQCATRTQRWLHMHTEFGEALEAAQQAVDQTTRALDLTHPAIDVQAWQATWADVRAEVEALTAVYDAPTVEDLARIDRVEAIIEQGLDLCSRLASLERDRQVLTRAVPRYRASLGEVETQLRQLTRADRYPLSRLPLQRELETLTQRASEIGKPRQTRSPAQLAREAEDAQGLLQAAQALVDEVAALRKSREILTSLIDSLDDELEPDFKRWAADLHAHISRHAPEDWSPDLRVRQIVADAQAIETRRERWVPADPTAAIPTGDLARRVDACRRLIQDGLRYQRRLDRITERLRTIDALDRGARETLDTVYQAIDRLALRAADVLPPLDDEQSDLRARVMDELERGYKLDLAFDSPTQGIAEDRAEDVRTWVADVQGLLGTWLQALHQEIKAIRQDLVSSLHSLNALAPLSLEPAVQETQARLEKTSTFASPQQKPHADARVPHLVALSEALGDRLRTRTRLHQTRAFLRSDVIEALTQPRDAWERAREEAEQQLRDLIDLEEESQRTWLPLSCGTEAVDAQMAAAYEAEAHLRHHGETVPQVIATLRDATRSYAKATAMADARAETYKNARAHVERRVKEIERWQDDLERYRQTHGADPAALAAVRARIEEIDAAMQQLSRPDRPEGRRLTPEEAKHSVDRLWEQARRDLPLGAGDDVIPMRHIERGW
jgi:chromosome segregation ATPase